MATRIGAEVLRWSESICSLEVGRKAEMLLLPIDDWQIVGRVT
jgi:cytosine/adenosine deaminase-related metal-dependent hydrolase